MPTMAGNERRVGGGDEDILDNVSDISEGDIPELPDAEEEDQEMEELPHETRCKIEGMKMMARWLTGLKSDTVSAKKTFRMLNAFISCKGDLLEEGKPK